MNLRELNEKIQAINPKEAFQEFAKDNPTIFTTLLKNQMSRGEDGLGLAPIYKSQAYAKEKQLMNPKASGRTDLLYTGDFYKGFFLKSVTQNELELYSTDSKAGKLTKKYDSIIWTFNNTTISQAKQEIINNDFRFYLI